MFGAAKIKELIDRNLRFLLPQLPAVITEAYKQAQTMGKNDNDAYYYDPPLEKERIADEQGRMVQQALHRWANNRKNLVPRWHPNKRNWPHLVLHCNELRITPHRVSRRNAFPRPTSYRQQYALGNQCLLTGLEPEYDPVSGIYMYLLHGPLTKFAYEPGFIQIAAPEPKPGHWIYIEDVVISESERTGNDKAPIENIQKKNMPSLKFEIDKDNES